MTNTLTKVLDRLAFEAEPVVESLDRASWIAMHHARDWQAGIAQRYYLNIAADRVCRVTNWLANRVDGLNSAAYDGWVLSGREWDRSILRAYPDHDPLYFLRDGAPETSYERAVRKAREGGAEKIAAYERGEI